MLGAMALLPVVGSALADWLLHWWARGLYHAIMTDTQEDRGWYLVGGEEGMFRVGLSCVRQYVCWWRYELADRIGIRQ